MNSKLNFWFDPRFWNLKPGFHFKKRLATITVNSMNSHQPLLFIQDCCSLQSLFSLIICPWPSNSFAVNLKMLLLVKIEFVFCNLWPFCHHPYKASRPWSDRRVPRLSIKISEIVSWIFSKFEIQFHLFVFDEKI